MNAPARSWPYIRPRPVLTDHNLLCAIKDQQRWHMADPFWTISLQELMMAGWTWGDNRPVHAQRVIEQLRHLRAAGRVEGCEQTGWRAT